MYKTFVAGITAISLTLSSAAPAQANGLSEDDIGKLIFGLIALAGVATAIDNKTRAGSQTLANDEDNVIPDKLYTPRHPTWPRAESYGNNPNSNGWAPRSRVEVPGRCVVQVATRNGTQQIVGQRCIRRTTNLLETMPARCRVRLYSNTGPRNGWDPRCLRDQGIRVGRRN